MSEKGGFFTRKLAAAKYFGLVTKKEKLVETTELARKILSPINEEEKNKALISAFISFEPLPPCNSELGAVVIRKLTCSIF